MKTPIIAESGIKIKKITKLSPELPWERFWESFWLTFASLWAQFGRLWPKKALQNTCRKKGGKKKLQVIQGWPGAGLARP